MIITSPTDQWLRESLRHCNESFVVSSPYVGAYLRDMVSKLDQEITTTLLTRTLLTESVWVGTTNYGGHCANSFRYFHDGASLCRVCSFGCDSLSRQSPRSRKTPPANAKAARSRARSVSRERPLRTTCASHEIALERRKQSDRGEFSIAPRPAI